MNTVKERILNFINSSNTTTAEFERTIGVSGGYIKNISKSMQPDILEKISNIYPKLSIEWLLIGKGSMLKSNTNETSPINVDGDLKTIEMENKLRKAEALLDAMIEQNERLKAELAEYKAKEALGKESA